MLLSPAAYHSNSNYWSIPGNGCFRPRARPRFAFHGLGGLGWVWGVQRGNKLVIMPYKPKHVTYFWQHPSAQPTWAGAWRHIGGASARFRQDINMRIDAYESWERPLYVAKFLDMDRIFSYLWIRIFISVKIRKNVS